MAQILPSNWQDHVIELANKAIEEFEAKKTGVSHDEQVYLDGKINELRLFRQRVQDLDQAIFDNNPKAQALQEQFDVRAEDMQARIDQFKRIRKLAEYSEPIVNTLAAMAFLIFMVL